MYNKLLLIPLIVFSISPKAFADPIYCPPASAIHCNQGTCIIDEPYRNSWRIEIKGYPDGKVTFTHAGVSNPPNSANCFMVTESDSVRLISTNAYFANTSLPDHHWIFLPPYKTWLCTSKNIEACPFKSP